MGLVEMSVSMQLLAHQAVCSARRVAGVCSVARSVASMLGVLQTGFKA